MLTDLEKNAIREHYRAISENLPQFRPRTAQREMIAAIASTFARSLEANNPQTPEETPTETIKREGESIAVIEGPTGVGKSLSYLLAGSIMAQTRRKHLIVSSATIALQEQLVNRDLPFLIEHSGLELSFAIAKGRGRYLCPYKLYQLTQTHAQQNLLGFTEPTLLFDKKPSTEDLNTLHQIADAFASRRFNGDRDTWQEKIADDIWIKINNDRHSCLKATCPNYQECPFFLARAVLETVDVIVANHDLLLADISMGGGVILPPPENSFYCIDEAHHLAKKALNQFSAEHSLYQAVWLMEKLPTLINKIHAVCQKDELVSLLEESSQALLESLSEWQYHLDNEPLLDLSEDNSEPLWLWADGITPEHLVVLTHNTALTARTLLKHSIQLGDALANIRRDKEQNTQLIDNLNSEWNLAVARIEQIAAVWDLLEQETQEKEAPLAKWIERKINDKNDYIFHASPISSASHLANSLWKRAAGAILTSATLRSLGNFDLLLRQTGLIWFPATSTLALNSPFNFAEQGELYLPPLSSSPKTPSAHTDEVLEWLPKLIDLNQAIGTLVLFTSRKQMHDVAMRLPAAYLPHVLIQGELPKHTLLERHHTALADGKASIIFGLDSFAEGLDLPGEACVHVIIIKLPFSMPNDPIERTQSRWIEQRGGNPFIEITVPEASIKLVQAVGRLIRSESDYGRVTILDNRLLTQRYGKQLLACLPDFKRI